MPKQNCNSLFSKRMSACLGEVGMDEVELGAPLEDEMDPRCGRSTTDVVAPESSTLLFNTFMPNS